jgi:PhnB protein
MAKAIPDGYHSVTNYLIVDDAVKAMAFYAKALNATEILRLTMPDGTIAHGEFKIGDSPIMLGQSNAAWGSKDPKMLGGTPVGMAIYVNDCDAAFKQAVEAGCTVKKPVTDQFYGDRSGTVVDPFGHEWTIGTHIKDMTAFELQAAMEEMCKNMPQG